MKTNKNLTIRSSLVPMATARGNAARANILPALLWLTLLCASAVQTFAQGGISLWTNRYDSGFAYAAAVDSSGNVFVTGAAVGDNPDGFVDYATVAYSGTGVPLWTNRYDGPGHYDDYAYATAVDSNGNVFVTGESYGILSAQDYATIKYSSAGVPMWTNRYDGPVSNVDSAYALAVDSNGNVIVTGRSMGDTNTYEDYLTIKYSNAGVALWTNRYDGGANGSDFAYATAVDSNGNVFVTGDSYNDISPPDYATIKYSSAGVPLWTNRYDGGSDDYAYAMAVDSSGNVIVTGMSYGNFQDYATIKYSSAGVVLWINRYTGPGYHSDQPSAVAVDSSDNVFVTGYTYGGTNTFYDYATIKYSSVGVPLWTNRYDGRCGPIATTGGAMTSPLPWRWTAAATCSSRDIRMAAPTLSTIMRRLHIPARACRCGPIATTDRQAPMTSPTPWRWIAVATCSSRAAVLTTNT